MTPSLPRRLLVYGVLLLGALTLDHLVRHPVRVSGRTASDTACVRSCGCGRCGEDDCPCRRTASHCGDGCSCVVTKSVSKTTTVKKGK